MGKSLNSRPVGNNPRPGKSLISDKTIKDRIKAGSQQNQRKTMASDARQTPNTPSSAARDKVYTSMEHVVSPQGISAFIDKMTDIVSYFAVIDNTTVARNMELAAGNGMSIDDRTVSFECAEYVIANMPFIFMGLVLNNTFKESFIKAVAVELSIDQQSDDVKKKMRSGMKDPNGYASVGSIVIGITSFTKPVEDSFFAKMNANFEALDPYAGDFDKAVSKLTTEDKMTYGAIFSNFMYLIRAFTHNDNFMGYVIKVIEEVKSTLKITG